MSFQHDDEVSVSSKGAPERQTIGRRRLLEEGEPGPLARGGAHLLGAPEDGCGAGRVVVARSHAGRRGVGPHKRLQEISIEHWEAGVAGHKNRNPDEKFTLGVSDQNRPLTCLIPHGHWQ